MEGLEKISPFVSFCQLCGFFPYRMEVDPVTKRFKRFTFSICHPATFWFFFVIPGIMNSINVVIYYSEEYRKSVDTTVSEMSPISFLIFATDTIDVVVVYILVYRSRLINQAVEFIQLADKSMESIPNKCFNFTPRIYVAAAHTFISVGGSRSFSLN